MIRRVCQCIEEFKHSEIKQRCRLIKIIHNLWAKIEPKCSCIPDSKCNFIFNFFLPEKSKENILEDNISYNNNLNIIIKSNYFSENVKDRDVKFSHILYSSLQIVLSNFRLISLIVEKLCLFRQHSYFCISMQFFHHNFRLKWKF